MKMKKGIARKLAALCEYGPKIQNPWIDVDKKIIIATDGHGLVVLPFTPEDGETSGFVPHQALRIWDCASRKRKSTIHCAGRVVVTFLDGEQTFSRALGASLLTGRISRAVLRNAALPPFQSTPICWRTANTLSALLACHCGSRMATAQSWSPAALRKTEWP